MQVKQPSRHHIASMDVVGNPSYIYNNNFIPEMTEIGFVFDLEEVMKVLEDAKTDISSNRNVIKTM